jgi:heme-degrading monooxygenase HmoA
VGPGRLRPVSLVPPSSREWESSPGGGAGLVELTTDRGAGLALDLPRETAKIKAGVNAESEIVYSIIWSFKPRPERLSEFETAYGPDGVWAQFFRKSSDYLGTELLRATDGSDRYLTIDRWRSRAAFEAFRTEHADEYRALDHACEALTMGESKLGEFEWSRSARES